ASKSAFPYLQERPCIDRETRSYLTRLSDQHLNSRSCSVGCEPVPDTTVALFPRLSVTVSVIDSACAAPASVLPGPPQVSPNENDEPGPDCVTVLSVP